jgi:hypothetical protein
VHNEAWVSGGLPPDPAECAVAARAQWGTQLGCPRYLAPSRFLIPADRGGRKGPRHRLWKQELPRLADTTGMIIEVCP